MAKPKIIYRCTACGYESAKWNGKCPSCGSWNTLEEDVPLPTQAVGNSRRKPVDLSDKIQELEEVDTTADVRYHTGVGELDRVLGGGLVRGSIVLLGGEPGIGKSTPSRANLPAVLRKGTHWCCMFPEESPNRSARAERLGVTTKNLFSADSHRCPEHLRHHFRQPPRYCHYRLHSDHATGGNFLQCRQPDTGAGVHQPVYAHGETAGHSGVDRGACQQGRSHCRSEGHGTYCGHRAVFRGRTEPVLPFAACRENRYGSTNEIGVFEMQDSGLHEVPNPSAMLLDGRPHGVSGTCVTCMMEGSRPILAEIQVLATKSGFSAPRRQTQGFDYSRMVILIAVLEKHLGMFFGTLDVYECGRRIPAGRTGRGLGGGTVSVLLAGGQADLGTDGCLWRSWTGRRSAWHFPHSAAGAGGGTHGLYAVHCAASVPARTERRLLSDSHCRRAESPAGVFGAGERCERNNRTRRMT